MKITIYELLGLVKDGKAPKKVRFDNVIWNKVYGENNILYEDEYDNDLFVYFFRKNLDFTLNDEVEILEEEKKIPEKIKLYTLSNNDSADFTTLQDFNNRDIQRTINWILDYLKSKGE